MHTAYPDAPVRLAAAGLGAVHLGIPAETVVQAIPVPPSPAMLPRRQGALRCLVEFDGALVPVVDLARWVDVGPAPGVGKSGQAGARILILREGGRTIGLQVDSVDGLVDVPASAVARLHHDEGAEEVFHSAAQVAESGQILSLLDVARLADLAASWHQVDPEAVQAMAQSLAEEETQQLHHYALLQAGALRLGVAAGDLVEVLPMPALSQFGSGIDSSYCLWRGRHLPVLAAHALPGLPEAPGAPLLAIVEHEGLVLGIPAQAALALQALPASGCGEAGAVTSTVYDSEGLEVRLLDTAVLFSRFPEALLSKPDTSAGPAEGAQRVQNDGGATNDKAYIVFEAGALSATPIGTVEQILPLEAGASPGAAGATMEWRGAAIPLVDLRPLAGTAGHVLVACEAGQPVGYVVTRVELLVPAGTARMYRMGAGASVEFITTEAAGGQASYRIVDLAQAAIAAHAA